MHRRNQNMIENSVAREELLEAACEAVGLLMDRQEHVPGELLDPREREVLRSLWQTTDQLT
jgi:hypothetical protein